MAWTMHKVSSLSFHIFSGLTTSRVRANVTPLAIARSAFMSPAWMVRRFSTEPKTKEAPSPPSEESPPNIWSASHPHFSKAAEYQPVLNFLQNTSLPPEKILDEFETMKRTGFSPDASIYSTLITRLAREKRYDKAFSVYEEYCHTHKPNVFMINQFMFLCLRANRPDKMFQAYQDMKLHGLRPSAKTFWILLKCCVEHRNYQKGAEYFEEMSSYGVHPDTTTYSLAIHLAHYAGKPARALQIYRSLQSEGLAPDPETLRYIAPVLAELSQDKDLNESLAKLREQNGSLTRAGYTTVMFRYGRLGRVDKLVELFEEASKKVSLDGKAFNVLITALVENNQLEMVIDYHTKMRQQNFFCTFRAYALLMRLALKTGKHDFVVQLFHEAKEARESLKLRARRGDQAADERKGALWADRIYPLAALALAEQDKCEEMVALLKENITQKWGIHLDIIAELMLLLNKRGRPDAVDQVFQLLEPLGYHPTKGTWMSAITALIQAGNVAKALQYEERMRRAGLRLPANMQAALDSLKTKPSPSPSQTPLPSTSTESTSSAKPPPQST